MPRVRRVGVHTYRAHRFEVSDDGGSGWTVAVYAEARTTDDARRSSMVMLRNTVPNGLDLLLEEARQQVDRALDGPGWLREP